MTSESSGTSPEQFVTATQAGIVKDLCRRLIRQRGVLEILATDIPTEPIGPDILANFPDSSPPDKNWEASPVDYRYGVVATQQSVDLESVNPHDAEEGRIPLAATVGVTRKLNPYAYSAAQLRGRNPVWHANYHVTTVPDDYGQPYDQLWKTVIVNDNELDTSPDPSPAPAIAGWQKPDPEAVGYKEAKEVVELLAEMVASRS